MKKVLILLLLGVLFISETSQGVNVTPSPNAPEGVWIKFLINFHRPKTNCVSGFSLCFIVTIGFEGLGGLGENQLCAAKGRINERNQLVIEVDEAALAKYEGGAMLTNFRDKKSITIQDPFPLPEATCKALGSLSPLTIKPGTYPILHKNQAYTIMFQL